VLGRLPDTSRHEAPRADRREEELAYFRDHMSMRTAARAAPERSIRDYSEAAASAYRYHEGHQRRATAERGRDQHHEQRYSDQGLVDTRDRFHGSQRYAPPEHREPRERSTSRGATTRSNDGHVERYERRITYTTRVASRPRQ
jgi:hypothetical protein